MRRLLVHFVVVSLALAVLVPGTFSAATLPENPKKVDPTLFAEIGKRGGQLTLALGSSPKSFNFYGCIDSACYTIMQNNVLEPLVEMNPITQRLEPALAERWEIAKDGKTVTFYLRKGVKWQDGHAFTADDVVFTMENVLMDKNAEGNSVDRFTLGGQPVKWYKVDDGTVKAVLPQPYGAFTTVLSHAMMIPKHKLADHVYPLNPNLKPGAINQAWTTGWNLKEIVGTGAFCLSEYVVDQKVVLTRNPYYWKVDPKGNQLPYFDQLVYLVCPSPDVQLAKFKTGELDRLVFSGKTYPTLKKDELAGVPIKVFRGQPVNPTPSPVHLAFNWDAKDPSLKVVFRNSKFREAMERAVDRDRIIEEIYGALAIKAGYIGVLPANKAFYNPDVEKIRRAFDLTAAAKLLDEVGIVDSNKDGVRELPNGKPVQFTLTAAVDIQEQSDIAVLIKSTLEKLGIKVDLQLLNYSLCFEKATGSDFEALLLTFGDQPDPQLRKAIWQPGWSLYYWHRSTMGKEKPNFNEMEPWEKRLWDLFELGERAMDPAERKKYYDEAQEIIATNLPVIMLIKGMDLSAVQASVGNAFQMPDGVVVWTSYSTFRR